MPKGVYKRIKPAWNKGKKGVQIAWNKGKKFSKETIERMKEAKSKNPTRYWLGKNRPPHSKETIKKMKLSAKRGEESHRWIKDRTKLKKTGEANKDRRSSAYITWRKNVLLRDNFKCKIANQDCNDKVIAHHILGYTEYPELRYKINNGITLCQAHHPRKRAEEKRLVPTFLALNQVSNEVF